MFKLITGTGRKTIPTTCTYSKGRRLVAGGCQVGFIQTTNTLFHNKYDTIFLAMKLGWFITIVGSKETIGTLHHITPLTFVVLFKKLLSN